MCLYLCGLELAEVGTCHRPTAELAAEPAAAFCGDKYPLSYQCGLISARLHKTLLS